MNIKRIIAKWLNITAENAKDNDDYQPKKFGESRSVEYRMDGMVETYCKVTPWANGEGFDISIETEDNVKAGTWINKKIDLHSDELDTLFFCLKDLGYFKT
jgi:hypothetical protein